MNINDDENVPAPIPAYLDQLINNDGVPRPYPGEDIETFRMRLVQHLIDTLGDSITDEQAFQMANDIIEEEMSKMSKIKYDQQVNNLTNQNKFIDEQNKLKKEELYKKMEEMPSKKDLLFKKFIDFMGTYRYNMGKEKKYFDYIKEARDLNDIKELKNEAEYIELQDFIYDVILNDRRNKSITDDDVSDLMNNFTYVGKEEEDFYGGKRRKRRSKTYKKRRTTTQKKRKNKTHKRRNHRKSKKSKK